MDQILQSHLVEPKATGMDGFDAFFAACTSAILDRIEAVMGKLVMGRDSVTPTPAQPQNGDDDESDTPEA